MGRPQPSLRRLSKGPKSCFNTARALLGRLEGAGIEVWEGQTPVTCLLSSL